MTKRYAVHLTVHQTTTTILEKTDSYGRSLGKPDTDAKADREVVKILEFSTSDPTLTLAVDRAIRTAEMLLGDVIHEKGKG